MFRASAPTPRLRSRVSRSGEPRAAVDGNVIRVISRLTNDAAEISSPATKRRFTEEAQHLLDPRRPGDFNQAMMELGATVCVPRTPRLRALSGCALLRGARSRHRAGTARQTEKSARARYCFGSCSIRRMFGKCRAKYFWFRELSGTPPGGLLGIARKESFPKMERPGARQFTHQIVNDRFRITVWHGTCAPVLPPGKWFTPFELAAIPLSTTAQGLASLPKASIYPSRNWVIPPPFSEEI